MIDIEKDRQDFDDAFDAAWPDQDTYHPSYREVVWDGWKLRAEHQSRLTDSLTEKPGKCDCPDNRPTYRDHCALCGSVIRYPIPEALIEKLDAAMAGLDPTIHAGEKG